MDFDDDVLYCYEIQLEADLMRQGLGRLVSVSGFRFQFPFPVSISGFRFRFPFLLLCCVEDLLVLSSSLLLSTDSPGSSVADPGPGAFLTPGSGIR
jgi:hypothetical protein